MVGALKAARAILGKSRPPGGTGLAVGTRDALAAVNNVLGDVDKALADVARKFAEDDARRIALEARVREELGLPPEDDADRRSG